MGLPGRLGANVSHELRTPIGALQAVLENLVDGVEPPDPATLRTMLRQVERLGRLVRQLLDLSRLESGAAPLHRRSFALRQVLDEVPPRPGSARGGAALDAGYLAGLSADAVPALITGLDALGPEDRATVLARLCPAGGAGRGSGSGGSGGFWAFNAARDAAVESWGPTGPWRAPPS